MHISNSVKYMLDMGVHGFKFDGPAREAQISHRLRFRYRQNDDDLYIFEYVFDGKVYLTTYHTDLIEGSERFHSAMYLYLEDDHDSLMVKEFDKIPGGEPGFYDVDGYEVQIDTEDHRTVVGLYVEERTTVKCMASNPTACVAWYEMRQEIINMDAGNYVDEFHDVDMSWLGEE